MDLKTKMTETTPQAAAPMQGESVRRYFGKYRGTVSDNNDKKNLGRIRALVPEVLDKEVSGWALPALPYSGNGSGTFLVPAQKAGVWIEFEAGDISRPIWTGCWWGSNQLPADENGTAAKPDLKILRSEKGLLIRLDDNDQSIAVSDSNGKNLLRIKTKDGNVRIQAGSKVVVEAPQIELVENASHALVFGDTLLSYLNQLVTIFNMHLHAGELAAGFIPVTPAPPVTPFPQATPSLLSTKVKTG
jgi:uncharacterized protein involved in type VI secretion and phage assembly